MACNENINEILNLDFSSVSDETNWVTNSSIAIQTINGQLKLQADDEQTTFNRGIGAISATNNQIRLRCNMDIFRPQNSADSTFCTVFSIYQGATLVKSFRVYISALDSGETVTYNLDRIINYDPNELSGTISLRITMEEGFANHLLLDYLIVEDKTFCQDKNRTYFALDGFLESAINSLSSAVQLTQWIVGGVETLTPAFFSENNDPGGDPSTEWKLAKADLDGSNRNANTTDPNTFNPFVTEWGLAFEDVAGNHFGGKPTGTISGSDYGTGILQIGFEKPQILNRNLDNQKGAFFIDIDYSQDLTITFKMVVNNTDAGNVFNSPDIHREYTITWSASKCAGSFVYRDVLDGNKLVDQWVNGFLSGLTGGESEQSTIGCAESQNYSGNAGVIEFQMDFGAQTGLAGLTYSTGDNPIKFEIEFDGQTYSTGYVGLNAKDQDLLNMGISPSEINTGNPSTGSGVLQFNKSAATPSVGLVRITTPFDSSTWNITGKCPAGTVGMAAEVGQGLCGSTPIVWTTVYVDTADINNYVPTNNDVLYTDAALTTPFNGGDNTYRMRVTDPPNQTILAYQFDVDAAGVISNVLPCSTKSDIDVLTQSVGPCFSCWTINVNVPEGQPRKVSITGVFNGGAGYAAGNCTGANPVIADIVDQDITETTTYTIGIDSTNTGSGGSDFTSTITVLVKNSGGTVLSQQNFVRTHSNQKC